MRKSKSDWNIFLSKCPGVFEIKLPELQENYGDYHFCGYQFHNLRPNGLKLKSNSGFDQNGRMPTPASNRGQSCFGRKPWRNP